MALYRIRALKSPNWGNKEIDKTLQLSSEELNGMVAIATALFEDDRDELFAIYDQAGMKLNLDNILEQSGAVVFEGEPAFDLAPEYDESGYEKSWLDTIAETARSYGIDKFVSKPYTVKAAGPDGMYLFQFEGNGFYKGMTGLINLLGLLPEDVLAYLHLSDNPLSVK